jgi:hypothetical protein
MNWAWNTALHTCIRKGPGGCTCTQVSQAWSALVWSQSSSPASDWSCEGWATNTQNWCARLLLFLHPWAISFCPPTACLLFIALQLICSVVLNGAEQTWVSWVDMGIPGPDFEPLRARLEKLGCQSTVLFCFVLHLGWAELMFLLRMCKRPSIF